MIGPNGSGKSTPVALPGRTVIAPVQLPASPLTALIGAPYFFYRLKRNRRDVPALAASPTGELARRKTTEQHRCGYESSPGRTTRWVEP